MLSDHNTSYGLVKIALLLVTGVSGHLSLSPPNPPVPKTQCLERRTFFERCVRHVTFCSKMMIWAETICDILATFAHVYPAYPLSPILSRLLCPFTPPLALTKSHPLLLLGTLSVLSGAVIRLACFRALGPLFTFELTITPSHRLVSGGPYAIVRHPSYTGVFLTLVGASAVGLAPGAWLRECWLRPCVPYVGVLCVPRVGATVAWAALTFWVVKVSYAMWCTLVRLAREDEELHRAFGKTWEVYAERVRWRLVPGVY
ncbi:hypothetical protein BKA93DRAFT_322813 [Sparassis latifolia]|uniref:Protein-S-isoprenylcysteine O-methyltransferase n=1 Tax=Sparassis crispa TaxID=139825 RepID=A0A401GQH3_9APHY|nr:hypothetical protein SCP_0604550 [Sparassis crispa]GBE84476.1 hypothetical protein SCP_0604550 [Sparassis crispa]